MIYILIHQNFESNGTELVMVSHKRTEAVRKMLEDAASALGEYKDEEIKYLDMLNLENYCIVIRDKDERDERWDILEVGEEDIQ